MGKKNIFEQNGTSMSDEADQCLTPAKNITLVLKCMDSFKYLVSQMLQYENVGEQFVSNFRY